MKSRSSSVSSSSADVIVPTTAEGEGKGPNDLESLDALHDAALEAYRASRKGSFAASYLLADAEDSPLPPLPDAPLELVAFIRVNSERNIVRSRGNSRAGEFTSQDLPFKNADDGTEMTKVSSYSSFSSLDSECSLHLTDEAMQLSYEKSKSWFLQYVLQDKASRKVFMNYLKNMHCAENLMFWLEVERYKKIADKDLRIEKAKSIRDQYLVPGAIYEVNLPYDIKREVEKGIANPTQETFNAAQKAIFLLMVHGTFDFFVNTERKQKETEAHTLKKITPQRMSLSELPSATSKKSRTKAHRSMTTGSSDRTEDIPQHHIGSFDENRQTRSNTLPISLPSPKKEKKEKGGGGGAGKKKEKCVIS